MRVDRPDADRPDADDVEAPSADALAAQLARWAQRLNDASPIQPVEDEPEPPPERSTRCRGRRGRR